RHHGLGTDPRPQHPQALRRSREDRARDNHADGATSRMTIRAQILSALDKALEAGRHSGAALEAVTEEFASSLRNLQMPPARAFGPVLLQPAPAFAAAVLIRAHHLLGLSTRKTVDWWFQILGSPSEQIRFVAEVVGIKVSGP